MKEQNTLVLIIIVLAQFGCTSLWFASNAVMAELVSNFNLQASATGDLTSAVQFGFIVGTLVFAILTVADRFSPSKVFFVSAIFGALFNIGLVYESNAYLSLMIFRFFTGFFLAGIYPVGMKIAVDYFDKGLGKSLGFLVGALVLGTAFPHLLKSFDGIIAWHIVVYFTSILALLGGLAIRLFVPDGPFRKASIGFDFSVVYYVFKDSKFRSAAFGYFGHMWELYAFWAFVPIMLASYNQLFPDALLNISLWSFIVIALGAISCMLAGLVSIERGVAKTAFFALAISCICCLVSPLVLNIGQPVVFIGFLLIWGFFVIADSPLFSTLVAKNASPEIKGTALTIVNCVGFSITIISIQLLQYLYSQYGSNYIYLVLAIGPLVGLWALRLRHSEGV